MHQLAMAVPCEYLPWRHRDWQHKDISMDRIIASLWIGSCGWKNSHMHRGQEGVPSPFELKNLLRCREWRRISKITNRNQNVYAKWNDKNDFCQRFSKVFNVTKLSKLGGNVYFRVGTLLKKKTIFFSSNFVMCLQFHLIKMGRLIKGPKLFVD